MQPRMVLIDHDNCLTPTDGNVGPGFFEGLMELWQLLQQWGGQIPFGFCTGRDRNYVEEAAFITGLAAFPNSWSVIESGVALFNANTKDIKRNPALTKEVKRIFEMIRSDRLRPIIEKHGLFDYPGNEIMVAIERQHGDETPIEEYYRIVRAALQDLEQAGQIIIHHSAIAVDISPVGSDGVPIDKGTGVKFLGKETGIDPAEILGIGDSQGDFPMLELVGFVGCPSNASQACQDLVSQRGGHISCFPHSQGVADVIRHFLEGSP